MKLRKDIDSFLSTLPKDITLVAVSKYVDVTIIKEMIAHGIHIFGESRVDVLLLKMDALKEENISWHFIGHLQTNKVKKIINSIDCLHSLDSLSLAEEINKYRTKPLDCFLEINFNDEESKTGLKKEEAILFLNQIKNYPNIHLLGLMMISEKNTINEEKYQEFETFVFFRDELEKRCNIKLPYLSMGMSDDYLLAFKAGSTHIRLGRILYEK